MRELGPIANTTSLGPGVVTDAQPGETQHVSVAAVGASFVAPPPSSLLGNYGARVSSALTDALRPSLSQRAYTPRRTQLPPAFPARADTPIVVADPALAGMTYSSPHDIHYDGDFTVPGTDKGVARFDSVMARSDWPAFVRAHLSVGEGRSDDPLRLMIPGLNTPLEQTQRRLPVFARETGFRFIQLANGTTDDLAPLIITLPNGRKVEFPTRLREWAMAIFQRVGISVAPRGGWPATDARGRIEMPPKSGQWLDRSERRGLQDALNMLSDPNKRLIDNTQRFLIACIDRDDVPPLEVWAYSEGSIVFGEALRDLETRYLAEHMRACPSSDAHARLSMLQARFRERLDRMSVIALGPAYATYALPIRRVDFFAANAKDPVARFGGPSRQVDWFREAHDIVNFWEKHDAEIPYEEPWHGFDAHNIYACGASALSLTMDMNGVRTVRELWERSQRGTLRRPSLTDVNARIKRDGAQAELWWKDGQPVL